MKDGFEDLAVTVSIIERQINVLKRANLPFAVQLLEMTKLELMIHMNDISVAELGSFCAHVREAMDRKSLSNDV